MSHATTVQQADDKAEARLLKLLGQPAEWLYQMRYNNGLAWLHQHFGFDPRLEKALATMPNLDGGDRNYFWGWWLNDWRHRDTVLNSQLLVQGTGAASINQGGGSVTLIHNADQLAYYYQQLHDPKTSQRRMPGFILDEAKRYLRTALPDE